MARSTTGTDLLSNATIPAAFWFGHVWSIAGWVDAGSTNDLFAADAGTNTARGWHIYKDPSGSGKVVFTIAGIADYPTVHNNPTGLFHFAITCNGTAVKVYIDGVSDSLTVATMGEPLDAGLCVGGTNRYGGIRLAGTYAEWAVWAGVISDADATALAKAFSPALVAPSILRNYWKILGRGSPEPDAMGDGALTLSGTAYATHPRVIYPRRKQVVVASAAAPASAKGHYYRNHLMARRRAS